MHSIRTHIISVCGLFLLHGLADAQLAERAIADSIPVIPSEHQVVLVGNIYGGPMADILVVSRVGGETELQSFGLSNQSWVERELLSLPPDSSGFDIATVGERDQLLVLWTDGLGLFNFETGEVERVFDGPIANAWVKDVLRVVDMSQDVNGDGLDDLIVPAADGLQIIVQRSDGQFVAPVRLDWLPHARLPERVDDDRHSLLAEARTRLADLDLDGRTDLVQWRDDHFAVYRQLENGGFAADPVSFDIPNLFDSDDPSYLVAPGSVRYRAIDHDVDGSFTGRVLDSLEDMTGDGIADISIFYLRGEGLLGLRHGYSVYAGHTGPDGLVFNTDPVAHFEQRGIPFSLKRHDLEGDGLPEIVVTALPPNVLAMIGGVIFRRMTFNIDLHRMDGGQTNGAIISRPLRAYGLGESDTTAVQFSPVRVGDFDGDGRPDLVIGRGGRVLDVYRGEVGAGLVAQRPERIDLAFRTGVDRFIVSDLNSDGAADIVIHAPRSAAPGHVTVWLSQLVPTCEMQ